jgi:hypothetical protein
MPRFPWHLLGCAAVLSLTMACAGSGGQHDPVALSSAPPAHIALTCSPTSGQQLTSPFFPGQNLKCSATQDGAPVSVRWTSTRGDIDSTGLLTHIDTAGEVSITASAGSASTTFTATYSWPVGAPGLVFTTATNLIGPMWDVVLGPDNRIYGAGWSNASHPVQALLYSVDFWSRKVSSYLLEQPSLLASSAWFAGTAIFAGGSIGAASYRPLVVSSDATPKPLKTGECVQPGMMTALNFDAGRNILWGAWSSDHSLSLVSIDLQTLEPSCSSAQLVEGSADAPVSAPWIWSVQSFSSGVIVSGHLTSADDTPHGYIAVADETGQKLAEKFLNSLIDVRISPPFLENGATYFYAAGHDVAGGHDVWTLKKLDLSLHDIWTRTWSGNPAGKNQPLALTLDASHGVFVAGMSSQLSPANGDLSLTDAVIMGYAADGSLTWAPIRISLPTGGNNSSFLSAIRITPDGNFLVAAGGGFEPSSRSVLLGFALPKQ